MAGPGHVLGHPGPGFTLGLGGLFMGVCGHASPQGACRGEEPPIVLLFPSLVGGATTLQRMTFLLYRGIGWPCGDSQRCPHLALWQFAEIPGNHPPTMPA